MRALLSVALMVLDVWLMARVFAAHSGQSPKRLPTLKKAGDH